MSAGLTSVVHKMRQKRRREMGVGLTNGVLEILEL